MSETALISCRRSHIQARLEDIPHAKILDDLLSRPGEFISSLQIGITIISIFSGAYSGQVLADPLGQYLNQIQAIQGYGPALAFGIVVIMMTYVSLLISELVPKRIAITYPEIIALRVATLVGMLTQTSFFMVSILDRSAKFILRLLGFRDQKRNSITEEELHYLLRQGAEEGAISTFEHQVFRRVLRFEELTAEHIMVARARAVVLNIQDSFQQHLQTVSAQPHRYCPIVDTDRETLLGVVDVKELIERSADNHSCDMHTLIQAAPTIHKEALAPHLLQALHHNPTKMILVIDENKKLQGLITPHDILEHLIGPLSAEHTVCRESDGSWLCEGHTPLRTLEASIGSSLGSSTQDEDTVASFVLRLCDGTPTEHTAVACMNYTFNVLSTQGTDIHKIRITHTDAVA